MGTQRHQAGRDGGNKPITEPCSGTSGKARVCRRPPIAGGKSVVTRGARAVYDPALRGGEDAGSPMARARLPDLILAGFGASDALQITVEAQQAVVRAGRVLALGLPGRLRTVLERQGVEITDLDDRFAGAAAAEAYAATAAAVLARAEQDPPAVFLSQGNPLLLNAVNRYLVVEANKRKLTVRVYPGVSPVDAIVADLGIDVGRSGLQTLSARGLVDRPVSLNPMTPMLLLQLAGVATDGASAEAYGRLLAVLEHAYPPSQPVTMLNMPGDGRITRATVTIERFAELLPHIDASSSLFIDITRGQPANSATSATAAENQPGG